MRSSPTHVFANRGASGDRCSVYDGLVFVANQRSGILDYRKVRDALKRLKDDGWYIVVTRGSHRQLKHNSKQGRVTVAGKPSDELPPGTLNSISKQAGLK